ncbi:hypothetical protein QO209_16645 [Pseudomonas citronellolis]|uniref:hypothetical protein n=1 Tax=Pseudomonas citronellolis TaxID=53408 RepID=UPI0026487D95|nr:hypothetical protein [Pseudomonas citronellolis]MDN6874072.1 hypothetical protein [Pseudomonas citronellolis]
MTQLAISERFDNAWKTYSNGAATVSIVNTGRTLRCSKTADADSAYGYWRLNISGGARVRVRISARNLSGNGVITLENPLNTRKNRINVDSTTWKDYVIEYTAPKYVDTAAIAFLCGVTTTELGTNSVEFQKPRIEVFDESMGPTQVIAMGLVRVTASGGGVGINANHRNFGIGTMTYDATNKRIVFSLDRAQTFGGSEYRPLVFIHPTYDGISNASIGLLHYRWGAMANSGQFYIQAYQSDGTLYDLATAPADLFFSIKVEM